MADPYIYWRAMLDHVADKKNPLPDFDKNIPPTGFWRNRRGEAVATWWQGGRCFAVVHTPNRTGGGFAVRNFDKTDLISDLMAYCVRSPIPHEAYKAFIAANGVWPEDVVIPTHRLDKNESGSTGSTHTREEFTSPEQEFSLALDGVIGSADAYLNETKKINPDLAKMEKVRADRIANYAIASGAIATRAESARTEAKRPILEAGRAIDARWNPIVEKAEKVTKNLKTILVPYFNEQKRIAAEKAAEAQKAREAATLAGETPPLASAQPSPTTAGTQGRVYLKGQKVYRITDLRAAAEFIAKLNQPPQEFVDGVQAAVVKLIKAGVEVPGAEVKTEDAVA